MAKFVKIKDSYYNLNYLIKASKTENEEKDLYYLTFLSDSSRQIVAAVTGDEWRKILAQLDVIQ